MGQDRKQVLLWYEISKNKRSKFLEIQNLHFSCPQTRSNDHPALNIKY